MWKRNNKKQHGQEIAHPIWLEAQTSYLVVLKEKSNYEYTAIFRNPTPN
jgi:hypothetical protein